MFTTTKDLKNLVVRALDGELGIVDQLYFDDQTWAIRYFTVATGGWFGGTKVLIPPTSVTGADWKSRRLDVALTLKQVRQSPNIDTQKPVSRQQEGAYLSYYGYPYYWDEPNIRCPAFYPAGLTAPRYNSLAEREERIHREPMDVHLCASDIVSGYHVQAADGEIGHIDRFIVDDRTWVIRYLEVATQNWWPGKRVLLSPAWVERVCWRDLKVVVGVSRKALRSCEEYIDGTPILRDYESRLKLHYGRPPYWINEAEPKSLHAVAGV